MARKVRKWGGSSYKEELPTAKPHFKNGATESVGKDIPVSVQGGVDGFCLG